MTDMNGWEIFYTEEFMREHHVMLEALRCEDADGFFAARRAAIAAHAASLQGPYAPPPDPANAHQATCPTCGQPLPGGVPAADPPTPPPAPDANIANEPTPSGYMSRKKML